MYVETRPTGAADEYGIWERVPPLECVGRLQLRVVPAKPLGYIGGFAVLTPDRTLLHVEIPTVDLDHDRPGSDDCKRRAEDRAYQWAHEYLRKLWYGDEPVPSAFYKGMLS